MIGNSVGLAIGATIEYRDRGSGTSAGVATVSGVAGTMAGTSAGTATVLAISDDSSGVVMASATVTGVGSSQAEAGQAAACAGIATVAATAYFRDWAIQGEDSASWTVQDEDTGVQDAA